MACAMNSFLRLLNHQNQLSNFSPGQRRRTDHRGPQCLRLVRTASLIIPTRTTLHPGWAFSYHPMERVVLRGGYGIFYQHTVRIGSESILALNPPAVISYSLSQILGSNTPEFQLQDGFPIDRFTSTASTCHKCRFAPRIPNERLWIRSAVQLWSRNTADEQFLSGRQLCRQSGQQDESAARTLIKAFITGNGYAAAIPSWISRLRICNDARGHRQSSFLELATNDGNSTTTRCWSRSGIVTLRGFSYGRAIRGATTSPTTWTI